MHEPSNGKVTCTELFVRVGESIQCWANVLDQDTTPRPTQYPHGSVPWQECDPVANGPCTTSTLSASTCPLVSYGGAVAGGGPWRSAVTFRPAPGAAPG